MARGSQWGEDRYILDHLSPPSTGVFIDVGASDGIENSNTYLFEQMGWTGLLIEPDPRHLEALKRNRKQPIETVCIASTESEVDFHLEPDPTWSGLLRKSGKTIRLPAVRLDSLLLKHHIEVVDILSIDTEGSELDVWKSIGLFRPGIVVVEWNTGNMPDQSELIKQTAEAQDYKLVHQTEGNFILEDWSGFYRA